MIIVVEITYSKGRMIIDNEAAPEAANGQLAQPAAGTRMLNEASPPEAVRSVIHPSVIRPVHHTIPLLRV
jgi:hypothetical protein